MGDVAMTVPVLRVLTQNYPELKLTILSKRLFEPLFSDLPNVHFLEADVYGEHKGFLGLLKLSKEIKELRVDAVADLHNVIRSKVITRNLSLKGVQTASINKGRLEKKKLTNAKGLGLVQLKSTHQRYADVFEELGFSIDLSAHKPPKRKPLNSRLHTLIGREPKKCIGIAPFAAYTSKMYPLESIKEVITHLDGLGVYRILLFGGGKEEIEQLKALESTFSSVTNVAGVLTFLEELELISNLDVMVSMDSANGHLAAMYNIPVITLWGVTHPYAGFVPFQQPEENQLLADRNKYPLIPTSVYGNKFPPEYENAMASIPSNQVIQKIVAVI
ncbi:MAG: glycosyltransferase family 9 protein [Flavobacteriaceae bacterium]|nr:glycosyltransferase family 9 protein [Flavobacteriaceae bacterium]